MRHLGRTPARVAAGRTLAMALLTAAALGLALLGLVIGDERSSSDRDGAAVPPTPEVGKRAIKVSRASWVFRPASLPELVRHSSAAVEASDRDQAGPSPGARSGPSDKRARAGVPDPAHRPRGHEGVVGQRGGRIAIFKTGSETEYIEEDPFYAVGEDYLIFLGERRPDGSLLPSAPDGRLRVVAGRLQPVAKGRVGDLLAGVPVEAARRATLAIRRGG